MKQFIQKYGPTIAVLGVTTVGVMAQAAPVPDATVIITAASSAATVVMGLCVTVGTFFAVFKVVQWIRK